MCTSWACEFSCVLTRSAQTRAPWIWWQSHAVSFVHFQTLKPILQESWALKTMHQSSNMSFNTVKGRRNSLPRQVHRLNGYLRHKGYFMWTSDVYAFIVESWSQFQALLLKTVVRRYRVCPKASHSCMNTFNGCDDRYQTQTRPAQNRKVRLLKRQLNANLRWNVMELRIHLLCTLILSPFV